MLNSLQSESIICFTRCDTIVLANIYPSFSGIRKIAFSLVSCWIYNWARANRVAVYENNKPKGKFDAIIVSALAAAFGSKPADKSSDLFATPWVTARKRLARLQTAGQKKSKRAQQKLNSQPFATSPGVALLDPRKR